jgi:hypothetical protein
LSFINEIEKAEPRATKKNPSFRVGGLFPLI